MLTLYTEQKYHDTVRKMEHNPLTLILKVPLTALQGDISFKLSKVVVIVTIITIIIILSSVFVFARLTMEFHC